MLLILLLDVNVLAVFPLGEPYCSLSVGCGLQLDVLCGWLNCVPGPEGGFVVCSAPALTVSGLCLSASACEFGSTVL